MILLSALLNELDSLPRGRCFVVATCTNKNNVPIDLLGPRLLSYTVALPYPAQIEREFILRSLMFDPNICITLSDDTSVEETSSDAESLVISMAKSTQGCSYGDLVNLLRSEIFKSESRRGEQAEGKVLLARNSLLAAAMEYTPLLSASGPGDKTGSSWLVASSCTFGGLKHL